MSYVFSKSLTEQSTTFGEYVDPISTVNRKRKIVYSIEDEIVNISTNMVEFFGTKFSESSESWFNVTSDGTEYGDPLFESLDECFIVPSIIRDTASNDEIPFIHIRRVENNRQVLLQLQRSNSSKTEKGISVPFKPNDIPCIVQIRIVGIQKSIEESNDDV